MPRRQKHVLSQSTTPFRVHPTKLRMIACTARRALSGRMSRKIEVPFELLGFHFTISDLFSRVLFPFCPFCWPPLFLPFSRHIFALFFPSKSVLFCRAKGTVQSLERGSSGMHLSTKFGKEIPSRNLREKRSDFIFRELISVVTTPPI